MKSTFVSALSYYNFLLEIDKNEKNYSKTEHLKKRIYNLNCKSLYFILLGTGLEPARPEEQGILSPLLYH